MEKPKEEEEEGGKNRKKRREGKNKSVKKSSLALCGKTVGNFARSMHWCKNPSNR
jgi:hypothetical protein